jgi:hypothetical protein
MGLSECATVGGPRPRRPSRPSGPTYKTLDERWGRPTEAEERFERGRRTIGLFLGPLVFVVLLALPFDLEGKQQALAAILGLVVVWWITDGPCPGWSAWSWATTPSCTRA